MKRKFLEGFLMLSAAAAVCVGGAAIEASANTITTDTKTVVTIDYEKQTLTVNEAKTTAANKDLQILFGVSSAAKPNKKNPKSVIKTAAWETYDLVNNEATIDLSSLKNTADNYIQIKGNKNTDPITIMIPAVEKKVKGVFDAATAKVNFGKVDGKNVTAIPDSTTEYRTQYGSWTEYVADDVDLKMYQQRGATLYFRTKAADATTVSSLSAIEGEGAVEYEDVDKNALTVLKAATFPGVEAKVATGKLANAPKATADYVKNTVKFPKNAEFRYIAADAKALPADWTPVTDPKGLVLGETAATEDGPKLDLATAGSYEIRTAAVTGDKAKPASKTSQLPIGVKREFEVATGTDGDNIGGTYIGADADNKVVEITIGTLNAKTKKYPVTLTSKDTEDVYEVIAVTSGSTPAFGDKIAGKVAAAKVKGEAVTPAKATIQITENLELYIRKAGNKKTTNWTTDWVKVGTVAVTPSEPTE